MAPLTPYLEEISLGIVDNPHAERPMLLTEMVTVCPSCRSLHSLRRDQGVIRCTECSWTFPAQEPAHAA